MKRKELAKRMLKSDFDANIQQLRDRWEWLRQRAERALEALSEGRVPYDSVASVAIEIEQLNERIRHQADFLKTLDDLEEEDE